MTEPKTVVVLAGPNGAGKTTNSRVLLPELLAAAPFINADIIESDLRAAGALSAPAIAAGRQMLERIDELMRRGENFSFETTLASRTFAPLLRRLAVQDYHVVLLYFWLRAPELAVIRVAERVRRGGHHVPEEIVRRRYQRGLHNFFNLYRPLAHVWRVYDNSDDLPVLVAHRLVDGAEAVFLPATWQAMQREAERR